MDYFELDLGWTRGGFWVDIGCFMWWIRNFCFFPPMAPVIIATLCLQIGVDSGWIWVDSCGINVWQICSGFRLDSF